jgi:hypothetical protein
MRLKHIDSLSGRGKIYQQESFVADCTYELQQYERIIDVPSHSQGVQELSDGFEIKGIITPIITTPLTFWFVQWIGKPLVLHLSTISDKHKLEFVFLQSDGVIGNGTIWEED